MKGGGGGGTWSLHRRDSAILNGGGGGAAIVAPIVTPIHIKHVHSSVSYQWAIYQKYNWRGHE